VRKIDLQLFHGGPKKHRRSTQAQFAFNGAGKFLLIYERENKHFFSLELLHIQFIKSHP
jgi:hypothetical protein